MKRSVNSLGGLLALLALVALGLGLIALFSGLTSTSGGAVSTSPIATPSRSLTPQVTSVVFQSPLATPTPAPTTTPATVPPPPNWPTGEPWPPSPATLAPPSPTALIPTRSPVPTLVGIPPTQLEALYYVADNDGEPEIRVIGIDQQGKKWSESVTLTNLVEKFIPTELHLSPDSKYLAVETFGMASPLLIAERSSGRTWCPLGKLENCVGGFGGWTANDQLLFRPHAGTQLERAVLGGALLVHVGTGEYEPLDLPFSSDRTYSFASNVSTDSESTRLAYSITYPENGKEISEIWTMRVDEQDKRLIRKMEGGGITLSWSPTGRGLVFLYQPGTNRPASDPYELWLLNSDGTGEKLLARGLCYGPTWSPDGRHVAFAQADNLDLYFSDWRGLGTNIYVADSVTGKTTNLSSFEGRGNRFPTWSPDGNLVAFVSVIPLGEPETFNPGAVYVEVWIANADGSQLYAVSGTANWGTSLVWSTSATFAQEK